MNQAMKNRLIHYTAMAIVNFTNELTKADVGIRQATNDEADAFAQQRIKCLLDQLEQK